MLTKRSEALKESIFKLNAPGVRKTTFYTMAAVSLQQTENEDRQIRRAKAFQYILEHVELEIHPYELLGGSITGMWPVDPDVPSYEQQYAQAVEAVRDYMEHRNDEVEEEISLRFEVQAGRAAGGRFALMARDHFNGNIDFSRLQTINQELVKAFQNEDITPAEIYQVTETFFNYDYGKQTMAYIDGLPWTVANHVNLNYGKVLGMGYRGILTSVEERKKTCTPEQEPFYEAMRITLLAAMAFIHKYADRYLQEAKEEDSVRAEELRLIGERLHRVAEAPAASFLDAVQLLWITHLIESMNLGAALSFARFDQYMYPYYIHDIQAKTLEREDAAEILRHLWLKVNEPKMRTVQSLALAGVTRDGADASNELTALCLEVTGDLQLPYPNISVRAYDGVTPEWVYDMAVQVIKKGFGMPMLINDNFWIQRFLDLGYPIEDARDYYNMGCVEMMISGKQADWLSATGGYISYPELLDALIEEWCAGKYDFTDFDALWKAYMEKLDQRIARAKVIANKQIDLIRAYSRDPFASALIADCVEKGCDLFCGGAFYPAHIAINGYGLATAADSFEVLKKLVFEEKKLTIQELYQAMQHDFVGYDAITSLIDQQVVCFGNDNEETDAIAGALLEHLLSAIYAMNDGSREEKFVTSFFSYTRNVSVGEVCGATPNGRKCGAALSDALGASQGRDVLGPTRMLNSIANLPLQKLNGAVATNLKVNPNLFSTTYGTKALKSLLKVHLQEGGPQIQVNFVSLDELKDAQKHPEKHRDLVVRVAGYCEYFVNLDTHEQQEIISRTEHEMES